MSIRILATLVVALSLSVPASAADWIAVALNPSNGTAGYAVEVPSKEEAEREAREACLKYMDDCSAVHAQAGGCLAVARGGDGAFGIAMKGTMQAAIDEALSSCGQHAGSAGCDLHTHICADGAR